MGEGRPCTPFESPAKQSCYAIIILSTNIHCVFSFKHSTLLVHCTIIHTYPFFLKKVSIFIFRYFGCDDMAKK